MQIQTTDPTSAAQTISLAVNRALSEGSVLLLLSGGSNIGLAVEIRKQLQIANQLTVGLIDERHGEDGHSDSNWQKLVDADFNFNEIEPLPVLRGQSFDSTAQAYEHEVAKSLQDHDTTIGIFGMGTDGHTAGILPNSPGINEAENVVHYVGPDFERITLSAQAISQLDEGYLVVFGEDKHSQLADFLYRNISPSHQPVQILKSIPNLTVMSDMPDEEPEL